MINTLKCVIGSCNRFPLSVSVYLRIGKKWFFENVENHFFYSNLVNFLRIHMKISKKTPFSVLRIILEEQGAYEEGLFQNRLITQFFIAEQTKKLI